MGRDLYDLVWCLADRTWPDPNLDLLNAAWEQTSWDGPRLTETSWREQIKNRAESLDRQRARADVEPFLERERNLELVKKAALVGLLS